MKPNRCQIYGEDVKDDIGDNNICWEITKSDEVNDVREEDIVDKLEKDPKIRGCW